MPECGVANSSHVSRSVSAISLDPIRRAELSYLPSIGHDNDAGRLTCEELVGMGKKKFRFGGSTRNSKDHKEVGVAGKKLTRAERSVLNRKRFAELAEKMEVSRKRDRKQLDDRHRDSETRALQRELRKNRGDSVRKSDGDSETRVLRKAALTDLKRSGLEKSDFRKLRLEVLSSDQTEDFVGEARASYRIPYFDVSGNVIAYSRVRFLETKKRKLFSKKNRDGTFRYSQPFNSTPHAYFPPYFNWRKIAKDPSRKILITEGEKKAAAACKNGIVCLALGGVFAFKSGKRHIEFLPELAQFVWKGRDIEICYDADVMLKSEVRIALEQLATRLSEFAPASLSFVHLNAETDGGTKTGIDDFLLEYGVDGFEKLDRTVHNTTAKIAELNGKCAWIEKQSAFYDVHNQRYFKHIGHAREAFMTMGEEITMGGKANLIFDIWAKSANRRTFKNVDYIPGQVELAPGNVLNTWKPPTIGPKKGKPDLWIGLTEHVFGAPDYVDWFQRWCAYQVQHPGSKLFQAIFVYGEKQGVGKSFVVDPVFEMIFGVSNFHRLQNKDLAGAHNTFEARTQFCVSNEVWLPEYKDRRSAMSELKDMITRETVTIDEKFQPKTTHQNRVNYYLTSNHADALILERDDRRFFVIQAPSKKLDASDYRILDKAIRTGDEASKVMHYLQNMKLGDFDPKGDAMMTEWKPGLISLSRDIQSEFAEKVLEDPQMLTMVNGKLPDLELMRAEDVKRLFEIQYPKAFPITTQRMARLLSDPRLEKRTVRLTADSPLQTLYAVFNRKDWRKKRNRDWAEHYMGTSTKMGGAGRLSKKQRKKLN